MNQQNLGRATGVVLVTAAVCVLPYALIVKGMERNFSYLSIGVGLAVGYAALKVGKASGIAIGLIAAVATFAASWLADGLAIKWMAEDILHKAGIDYNVTLSQALHHLRAISYLIFAIGAFVAFGAAGGRTELRDRSSVSGAGRFTPDSMNAPAVPPATTPQPWVSGATYPTHNADGSAVLPPGTATPTPAVDLPKPPAA